MNKLSSNGERETDLYSSQYCVNTEETVFFIPVKEAEEMRKRKCRFSRVLAFSEESLVASKIVSVSYCAFLA